MSHSHAETWGSHSTQGERKIFKNRVKCWKGSASSLESSGDCRRYLVHRVLALGVCRGWYGNQRYHAFPRLAASPHHVTIVISALVQHTETFLLAGCGACWLYSSLLYIYNHLKYLSVQIFSVSWLLFGPYTSVVNWTLLCWVALLHFPPSPASVNIFEIFRIYWTFVISFIYYEILSVSGFFVYIWLASLFFNNVF